jgi:hypothetical protein
MIDMNLPYEIDLCPKCGSAIINVEYWYGHPQRYDGISEISCQKCDWRIGRFCGKELKTNEVENRFCEGKSHKVYN